MNGHQRWRLGRARHGEAQSEKDREGGDARDEAPAPDDDAGWSPPSAWTRSLIRSDAPTGLTPTGVRETASSTVLRARSRFEFPYRSTAAASASSSVVIRAALARSGSAGTKKRPLIATSATMRRIGSRRRWWEASWASTASSSAWSSSSTSPVDTTMRGRRSPMQKQRTSSLATSCRCRQPKRARRPATSADGSPRDESERCSR